MDLMKLGLIAGLGTLVISCAQVNDDTDELTGSLVMGPVAGAQVIAYHLNADGTVGDLIAETTTDLGGQYRFQTRSRFRGPILMVSKGGSYTDEATGELVQIPEDFEIHAALENGEVTEHASISAFTTMISNRARYAAQGDVVAAMVQSRTQIQSLFGLGDLDVSSVKPDDTTSDASIGVANQFRVQSKYGFALAAFSQLGKDQALASSDLVQLMANLSEDYKDGQLDNLAAGQALPYALSITPAQAINSYAVALQNWGSNTRNKVQLNATDLGFTANQQ